MGKEDSLVSNLKVLAAVRRPLYETVLGSWKGPFLGLSPAVARSGAATLRKVLPDGREVFLHSSGDPVREAERFAQSNVAGHPAAVLLLGFGLGYHVREVLKRLAPGGQLTVAILNPDAFVHALERIDLTDLLSAREIDFVWGSEAEILEQIFRHPVYLEQPENVIFHKPSITFAGTNGGYLYEFLDQVEAHRAFWATHGDLIRRNLEANLETVLRTPGVIRLFDFWSSRPCFIVGAGPSLDDALPHLEAAGRCGMLLAVGSALPPLARAAVRPHLSIAIDPVDPSADYIRLGARGVPLVFVPQVAPKVLDHHEGLRFVGLAGNESHGMYANTLVLSKGVLDGQGSVAVYALDLAIRMGCDPIVLVGVDLSSPGGRSHAGGHPSAGRGEVAHDGMLFQPRVEKVGGGQTYTLRNFHRFLRAIERRIEFKPGRTYINTSASGVRIRGTEEAGLEDVVRRLAGSTSEGLDRLLRQAAEGDAGPLVRVPGSSRATEPIPATPTGSP